MTAWSRVLLDAQLLALSNAELLTNQVQASGFFGDRVLNLQTGVDLKEGDEAVGAHQVLNGAGAVVASLAANTLSGLVDGCTLLISQEWGRSFLNQLLETTLQGAVTGAHNDDVAVLVSQDLCLNVAGLVEVLLDEALAAAERGDGLTGGGLEQFCNPRLFISNLHTTAATAESSLNGNWQTVLVSECLNLSCISN